MHIPDTGWTRGSWKGKLAQFNLLGKMIGLPANPSSGPLQEALRRVASAKVFAESVQDFIEATGKDKRDVGNELEHINKKLGTMEPVPFRSMMQGQAAPTSFNGVAILPAGTVSWMQLRWDQIKLHQQAGARFEHIMCWAVPVGAMPPPTASTRSSARTSRRAKSSRSGSCSSSG